MKIVRMLADQKCGAALDCPEVHLLDDGRALVRGFNPPSGFFAVPDHEGAVILDIATLRTALDALEGTG
jgi:hypothetical protein